MVNICIFLIFSLFFQVFVTVLELFPNLKEVNAISLKNMHFKTSSGRAIEVKREDCPVGQ